MSKKDLFPQPEGTDLETKESEESHELSPEEQKIADALKLLAEEQNKRAIKALAHYEGSYNVTGLSFRLLRNKGEDPSEWQLQIELPDLSTTVRNFDSWENNLEGLARELVTEGLTVEQMDNFVTAVQDMAPHIEEKEGKLLVDGKELN